jgi:Family of unknown function (DUF5928)/Core-2/I-Branching enzyme
MARIAFVLLCHKDPAGIIAQAARLTQAGDFISIHFDARARAEDSAAIRAALKDNPSVVFAKRRVKCGWGEWSLVDATLQAVRAAVDAFPSATHFYLLSGDCMPIKSAEYCRAFLDRDDADHIESVDFFASGWIRTGIKEERLTYRHWFNERAHKTLFYASMALQKRLKLERPIPADLAMQIGSQWWCLRRRTIEAVLDLCDRRADILRFFRTTWIPDETFFQTLVRHLVAGTEIRSRTLTFLLFSDYGMPVTFYNDHYDLLISQDCLFARKISPEAKELKDRLGELYNDRKATFAISNEGRKLFGFLTGRGRIGRRFAPRFWENEATIGRERTLMMVTCKKWHVAKRLVERMRQSTNLPAIDYLFNEDATPLPDLGGIQSSIDKRMRHRRALVRMLFDYWQTDRLVFCIDPASAELIQDFNQDKGTVRLLEIDCTFTDEYLIGHAQRVGLASGNSAGQTIDRLLPTIRHDMKFESDRLRDLGLSGYRRIRQAATLDENTVPLAEFLDISPDQARDILSADHLFAD